MIKLFVFLAFIMKLSSSLRLPKIITPTTKQLLVAHRSVNGVHRNGIVAYMSTSETTPKDKKDKKKKEVSKYSKSVILPQTSFDQRANSLKKEPEMQAWWKENNIYEDLSINNAGEKFILHDGPPYANGNLHIGHALNKILKDFINKYQTLRGKRVSYVPGWDCHGLPIELKVLQGMKAKEREGLTPIALRKKATEFALEAVENQRTQFKRYGVWGDWDKPYMTLQPEYEAEQIKVFGDMFTQGHIYRGKKPVHWSPSSRTALAEAELEYPENHISKSIYVAFQVTKLSAPLAEAFTALAPADLRVAIWTTTPWTIPANLAVAVGENIEYVLASHPTAMGGAKILVAKDLVLSVAGKFGLTAESGPMEVSDVILGKDLAGTQYQHPLFDRVSDIVIGGDYITTDSGTGLVHTAPGHGQEDYLTGLKYGLPLLSPVNNLGCFTDEVGPRFAGLEVLGDGNTAIITALAETGTLIKAEDYNHKYPYDWRTKKPTIFRATEQWFASVSTFRQKALEEIEKVQFTPEIGRNRIRAMVESRGDWCISRQRSWGVPIPVFYNKATNEPLMTAETLKHIESVFREHGSIAWWSMDEAALLPEGPLREAANDYTKGSDTMDVWFDSGTSWAGVAKAREELAYPADVYLEGSDQHRGWFQSSLLTSVASQGIAPYKKVITHGFVLDEKGYKMSKSLGNVVDPLSIIEGGGNQKLNPAYGADTMRLWISGVDYSSDVCIGANIMKQVSESYRKLRNTLRYLVGSIGDFDPATDAVPYEQLSSIDKYMLGKLSETVAEVQSAYDDNQFIRANQALMQLASQDLSSFYLDVAKDRLYISCKDDIRRRSCQTVLVHMLEQLTVMLAPLVPHMAEELWQTIPYAKPTKSVFQRGWVSDADRFPSANEETWARLRLLRNDVNKCIEVGRNAKEFGASLECQVHLSTMDQEVFDLLSTMKGDATFLPEPASTNGIDDLRFILMVSRVTLVDIKGLAAVGGYGITAEESESGVGVAVTKAPGKKCDRCWFYSESTGGDSDHVELCLRCADVVKKDGYTFDEVPVVEGSLPLPRVTVG
jgi:isoleucyl-tRNA synthetase